MMMTSIHRWAVPLLCSLVASQALSMGKKPAPPPGNPNLAISPLVLPKGAFGPNLADDADGDCMSDEAEHAVAMHFRPYLIFDSHERSLRSNEPVSLYRVTSDLRAPHCDHPPAGLRISYGQIYRDDGGFSTSVICRLSGHRGDNQALGFSVSVSADGTTFKLSAAGTGDYAWPKYRIYFFENHHPVIYLSAGKHHEYPDTSWNGAAYKYYYVGCREAVNGRGFRSLVNLESPFSPRGRNNVGESFMHPTDSFVGDLTAFGFPGEDAWGELPFCGGYGPYCSFKDTASMRQMWGD